MKIFHFWFQSILMIIWIILGIATLLNFGFWIFLAFAQVIIGVVHFIGSTILMIQYKFRNLKVGIHWYGSILLLIAIGLSIRFELNDVFIRFLLFGVPWLFAVYFWYLAKRYREARL